MRAVRTLVLVVAGVVLVASVLAVTAWVVTGRPDDGRVAPNVSLAGRPVGGVDQATLRRAVTELAASYDDASITIGSEGQRFVAATSEIGFEVKIPPTVAAVMEEGRTGSVPARVVDWLGSLRAPRLAPVEIAYDPVAYRRILDERDPGPRTPPVEPDVRFVQGELVPVDGSDGEGLTTENTRSALTAAARRGLPLMAKVERGPVEPRFTSGDVEALIRQAEELQPLTLQAGAATAMASPATLKSWLRTVDGGDRLTFATDHGAIAADLPDLLAAATTAPVQPHYVVARNRPVLDPGTPGTTCCDPGAPAVIEAELSRRLVGGPDPAPVTVPLLAVPPAPNPRATPDLGVTERVASFTTTHAPGQPRVHNIHRMADLVRGHVILPGENFSLNGHVGPRTTEKGFVADTVIFNGKFEQAVGGGVSQVATTLFNAAFFAGLDFGEYMAHTIYISRYPYGREATLSYPHPDLVIKNTTPYGILIWPSYTRSSITVDLYSTRYVTAEQTGQTTTPAGVCTRVVTERTRHYVDGRTAVDTVRALYQPEEGVRC